MSKPREGFTLVELLVVIAIIGVLVSLLLPAVQQAREAARRMSCQNNLKQIGLALHNYNDTYQRLPVAIWGANPKLGESSSFDDDGFGWMVSILPFVEQSALYDQLDATVKLGTPGALELYNDANGNNPIPGGETVLSMYRCPSSALPEVVPPTWGIPGTTGGMATNHSQSIGYAVTDYKAAGGSCYGDDGAMHKLWESVNDNGSVGRRFAEITDGLSNTILAGESSYVSSSSSWRGYQGPFPVDASSDEVDDWPVWIGGAGTDEGTRINGRTNSPINCRCSVSKMISAINDDCAFSFHPGGAQFIFGDGSVHFLTENLSSDVYCNLHSIRDGQVLGNWQ
ncbi:DUF1559 domain-containing protein [Bremerella cremea]|uniref:DUF1559 domain-containing protein n=1 Tax=Blastopirellula marina TaxID=124 RepID=A0A2S8FW56_9BACT|nr:MULTISPECIES: DUF1559 domain-containing protein [Pirellulaceae]PQO36398.1 hypothetical protein C5Y83_08330 [Blastopirellula marina]RCS49076.1 DUF1559 domain-containing protein [Bremerella cremea]